MAESTKYTPINTTLSSVPDSKLTNIFTFRTKRSRTFLYIFFGIFVAFTVFLAFNPSQNPSSPWFTNIFASSSFSISSSSTVNNNNNNNTYSSSGSSGSQFKSIYSYFFPNNSTQVGRNSTGFGANLNGTGVGSGSVNSEAPTVNNNNNINNVNNNNRTRSEDLKQNENTTSSPSFQSDSKQVNQTRSEDLKQNNKTTPSPPFQSASKQINQTRSEGLNNNQTTSSPPFNSNSKQKNQTQSEDLKPKPKTTSSPPFQSASKHTNQTRTEDLKQNNKTTSSPPLQSSSNAAANSKGIGDLVKNLLNCDLFDGDWVRDETYPLYKPGSCSLVDQQFSCVINGRPDKGFQMLKWKPKACTLPRFDGSHMLQLLKGKRLVFVGDSLNRNMWESLICILQNSVKDLSKVYEASGRHHFRSEPSYSFVFEDYNCTVEFFMAPFIVRESVTKDKNETKETLRLDLIGTSADRYKTADILVFNTGHWWTHEKTAKGKDYYQEGSHVYSQLSSTEAFRKAMTTWGRWVDANINPSKTLVFFRGYSASHFRGGQWNSGGQCDSEVEPIKNTTYLSPYPDKMIVLEKVLRGMKTRVSYLNITRSTDFRKDGHPSVYRKHDYSEQEKRSSLRFQDCSHWCLPGVPDSWNEILYAELLAKQYQNQQQKN